MKKWGMYFFIALLVLVGTFAAFYFFIQRENETQINSFDECVEAGFPVMESYPPQCRASNGKSFTQNIGNELEYSDEFNILTPRPNQEIKSPFLVTGQAKGAWYFEGSFSAELFDSTKKSLGVVILQAQSEWMTDNFVPFEGEVNFQVPTSSTGSLIITNANPSGLLENEKKIIVPVKF